MRVRLRSQDTVIAGVHLDPSHPERKIAAPRSDRGENPRTPRDTTSDPPSSLARNNAESGRRRSFNRRTDLLGQALTRERGETECRAIEIMARRFVLNSHLPVGIDPDMVRAHNQMRAVPRT